MFLQPDKPVGVDRSLIDLIRQFATDTATLVHQEMDLARAELSEKSKQFAASLGLYGAAGLFGLGAFVTLTAAIITLLALVLSGWVAALLVSVFYLAVATFAGLRGKAAFKTAASSDSGGDGAARPSEDRNAEGGNRNAAGENPRPRLNLALLKATWSAFGEDKAPRLAAAIAYSAIFSIAPLFIVLIAIVGWFIGVQNGGHGHHVAEDMLVGQVKNSAGAGTANTVRQMIAASFSKPRQSVIAQIIGWVTFIIGATALFGALQDALNAVWHVEATKGGWKQVVRDRLASFGMILVVGLLLLVSLVANIAIGFIGSHLLAQIPLIGHPAVFAALGQLVTLGVATVIFAAVFKVLPDVKIAWNDVWVGAIATAVLFVAGEGAIALYFRYAGVASAYGAAGSLLVAILWIYYSAILLLLGAEFTKVYAGKAETVAPTTIRSLTEHPAGVDPRVAGKSS